MINQLKRYFIILATFFLVINNTYSQENNLEKKSLNEVRAFFVSSLVKIGDPLLVALSKNKLKKLMPVEKSPGAWDDRTHVTYLEGFGRLLSGMAPWLEDFMNFNNDKQPLVDAAFFAQALIRAPKQLWEPLDKKTKENVINALKSTRVIKPYYSNWLLFSGMVEAALLKFDAGADMMRLDYPLNKHKEWYLGDGMYGDGPTFHWDYYNSFVIQPMILDILKVLNEKDKNIKRDYNIALKRAKRYAAIQERLISPDGTYPPIGRSLAYRFGAFQLLSQVALWQELPKEVTPAQVRSALFTMIKNQINAPNTFDKKGWLQTGLYGHQPNIGEGYISTGSLYLCSEAVLILGLPSNNVFWSDSYQAWTQKKIWSGQKISIDHAIKN